VKCSTPFAALPDTKKIIMEIERFINPPDPQVEKVTPKEGEKRRAR
jgi:hypothetical protein